MNSPAMTFSRLACRFLGPKPSSPSAPFRHLSQLSVSHPPNLSQLNPSPSPFSFSRRCWLKRTQSLRTGWWWTVGPAWAPSSRSYSDSVKEEHNGQAEKAAQENAPAIDEAALLAEYHRSYREETWTTVRDDDRDVRWMEMLGQRGVEGVFDLHELVDVLKAESVQNLVCLRVPDHLNYADYLVIGTGFSFRHLKSVMEYVKKLHKGKKGSRDRHVVIEGLDSEDWLVMDMGNLVLHLFQPTARTHWDLETLWTVGEEFDELTLRGRRQNADLHEMVYFPEEESWDLDQAPSPR